jgi:hypothetical protein
MAALDEDVPRLASTGRPPSVPFDARAASSEPLDDQEIDWDLVSRTLDDEALSRLALQPPRSDTDATGERLRLTGLMTEEGGREALTNAGNLLFSRAKPIRAIVSLRGIDRELTGNVFELYDVLTELVAASNEPFRLKGPESVDFRPYPPLAVKELLVNALVHRDYEVEAPIDISLDEHRLRIGNPGGLLDPDDIEGLGERSIRHYRNPSLAEVLYATGLMDKYGSGLVDVRRWARDGGAVATFDVGTENTRFEAVVTSRPDSRTGTSTVVPAGAYEIFYVNALRVTAPPDVWLAPTTARRPRDIFDAHPGEQVPRFVLDGRNLLTFSDLADATNPLRSHVESPERHSIDEICQTPAGEAHIIELLNRIFERHMQGDGIEVHHRKQRIWFHINDDDTDRVIEYQARMRVATRTVARAKNSDRRWPYFEHQALGWSFVRVDGEWLLTIDPTWIFTRDGRGKLESRKRTTQLSTRKMGNERNQSVLNHVFFWAWVICGDADRAVLDNESESVWIARAPLTRHEAGVAPTPGSGEDDTPDPDDLEHLEDDKDLDDVELDEVDDLEDP